MDPPSRVQSFYHSAMMPIPWLCTLTEEEEEEDWGEWSAHAPEWRSCFSAFSRDLTIPHLDLSHFALCIMGN